MDQVASDSPNLRRVDDLWFPRDTIVIRAEDTIFQVSSSILAARSTVFRDMVAFPQPPSEDTEIMDGSPVVRLQDAAADVEVFLRAIFDSSFFMPAPAPVELPVVLGILRLSHKYDVQFLHRRALQHLIMDGWYSSTFDAVAQHHIVPSDLISGDIKRPFSIVAACLEVGALWLLPWAYYVGSSWSPVFLLPLLNGEMKEHVQLCLVGHSHLLRTKALMSLFLETDDPCTTPALCGFIRREQSLHPLIDDLDDDAYFDADPFNQWPPEMWNDWKERGMCDICHTAAKTHTRRTLARLWERLPQIFGLPPWEELHQMKRAAMGEDGEGDVTA
ncbi:hypothetical protein DFH07DRAFT_734629 [Mycena maculata]|uniref:BTB domain-containing protein n=1 Tax=Mycena maculata TaxID=230809 RepID=A0AAD7JSY3_9AGAR|nr:hypothetical protein DFH07DRAFT_734629 [Mycena maculata]